MSDDIICPVDRTLNLINKKFFCNIIVIVDVNKYFLAFFSSHFTKNTKSKKVLL